MKNIDGSLETKQLRLLLTVAETLSLTESAERLGIGQSAVSHALNRMREVMEDPLFVRSGRGIAPTPYTLGILDEVKGILGAIDGLVKRRGFDPKKEMRQIVIAANEYQRDLILPTVVRKLHKQAPGIRLKIVNNPFDASELLRDSNVDLLLTPIPPKSDEVTTAKLASDDFVYFYDADSRKEPTSEQDFKDASYIAVSLFVDETTGCFRQTLSPVRHHVIRPSIMVNSYSGVPSFLLGSDMLAPLPLRLAQSSMKNFAYCRVPHAEKLTIHLCWHRRNQQSELHRWLVNLFLENGSH